MNEVGKWNFPEGVITLHDGPEFVWSNLSTKSGHFLYSIARFESIDKGRQFYASEHQRLLNWMQGRINE